MAKEDIKKGRGLIAAICIDLIGYLTYSVPLFGELGDLIWAPISAWLIYKLFRSKTAATIGLIEEALPWTDFIPTATLTWGLLYFGVLQPGEDDIHLASDDVREPRSSTTHASQFDLDPDKEIKVRSPRT
jgi:hypothetical protein